MLLVDGEVRGSGHEKCSVQVRGDGTGELNTRHTHLDVWQESILAFVI